MNYKYINIYNKLVTLTRNKELYKNFNKQDTFADRLVFLLLHFAFFLKAFKKNNDKNVLQEMTTVGGLGTGPQKKMMLKKTEYPPKMSKSMKYGKAITSAYGSRKSNKGN